MRIGAIDHINIRTADLGRCCRFYTEVLGLSLGERPPFSNPGAWLYAGAHPIVHVSVAEQAPDGRNSPVDHVALSATGIADTRRRLERHGVTYRVFDVPGRAMRQIFIEDPDGVSIELNFTDPDDLG